MKTTITDEDKKLTISNEGFNGYAFVNLNIGKESIDVPIAELHCAVEVFYERMMKDLKIQKLLK